MPTPTQTPIFFNHHQQSIITIPELQLVAWIVEVPLHQNRWDITSLDQSVGHLEGTAPPGSSGNAVLMAHVTLEDNRQGPFIDLARLTPDDWIYVQKGAQRFAYKVEKMEVVESDDMSVVVPRSYPSLTLLTCTEWNVPQQRYDKRLIVLGRLVETE